MFKKKLLTSFLALLLIIKLIKIKLMYVLPVIMGVNAAKKLLLKTLLFLFPPLVHLFKLCTYYHAHASKLHFHHHKVSVITLNWFCNVLYAKLYSYLFAFDFLAD